MTTLKRNTLFLSVLVNSLLLINCAGTPATTPVQDTQHAYQQIEKDSLVVNNAPAALKKAKKAVKDVENARQDNDDQASVDQLVVMAKQRIKIAQRTAELRAEKAKTKRMSNELNKLLADVHKTEQERIESGLAKMDINERVKYLHNFRVLHTQRGLVLRFLGVTFGSEKAYLKSSAAGAIDELTDFLSQFPERNIRIEGYTDNTGTKNYNKKLSQERANAVRQALISRGIDKIRIQAVGMGEQYPIANNKSKVGRMRNRRVEVIISDKSGAIPTRVQKQ